MLRETEAARENAKVKARCSEQAEMARQSAEARATLKAADLEVEAREKRREQEVASESGIRSRKAGRKLGKYHLSSWWWI